jgi:phosphoglycerol transferase MdoB-like AlkP superfamily enzyme
VERAERGYWPADAAMVRAIIGASEAKRPFFAFAFPSSTHSPYNFGTFRNSELDVLDPPGDAAGEVKEYINSLRIADRALGSLIEYFRAQPDSTIIAVLGDHVPPLSKSALGTYFATLSLRPEA